MTTTTTTLSRSVVATFVAGAMTCGCTTSDSAQRQSGAAIAGATSGPRGQSTTGGAVVAVGGAEASAGEATNQGGSSGSSSVGTDSTAGTAGTGTTGTTVPTANAGASGSTVNTGAAGIGNDLNDAKELACPELLTSLATDPSTDVCRSSEQVSGRSKFNVLVLLDKSSSMASVPAGYTDSKWAGTSTALSAALDPSQISIRYGFMLYPYSAPVAAADCELTAGAEAVNVAIGPTVDTVPAVNALMTSTAPAGDSPTANALAAAYDYYVSGAGQVLGGQKYVLLVTDGGPNCNPNATCDAASCTANLDKMGSCGTGIVNCCDPSLQSPTGPDPKSLCLDNDGVLSQIGALLGQGIKTFVVGIPGSEIYADYFDDFAVAGGVPVQDPDNTGARRYYRVESQQGLIDALKAINRSLERDCTVRLAQPPQDLSRINVAVDCAELPQTFRGIVNWQYNPTSQSIEIQGTECDIIKTIGVKRIDVVEGCSTIVML